MDVRTDRRTDGESDDKWLVSKEAEFVLQWAGPGDRLFSAPPRAYVSGRHVAGSGCPLRLAEAPRVRKDEPQAPLGSLSGGQGCSPCASPCFSDTCQLPAVRGGPRGVC